MDYNNSSVDLFCAQKTLTEGYFVEYSLLNSTAVTAVNIIFQLFLLLLGFPSNLLIIILITSSRHLVTHLFMSALHIAICNLILVIVIPTSVVSSLLYNGWTLGWHFCYLSAFCSTFVAMQRNYSLAVMALDHFLSVITPFFYQRNCKTITVVFSVFTWSLSLIISVILLPGILDCYGFDFHLSICFVAPSCHHSCSIYNFLYWSVVVPFAGILLFILYGYLYYKAYKIKHQVPLPPEWKKKHKATITFSLVFFSSVFVSVLFTIPTLIIRYTASDYLFAISARLTSVVYIFVIIDPLVILRDKDATLALKKFIGKLRATLKV